MKISENTDVRPNTDNTLTFKFDNKQNHSNIKANTTKLALLNANLLCCTFAVRRRQQRMRVWRPLNRCRLFCSSKLKGKKQQNVKYEFLILKYSLFEATFFFFFFILSINSVYAIDLS